MASSGSRRSGLLTAGGILSIIVGAFELIGGGIMIGLVIGGGVNWLIIPGVPILALGIVAIIGGISALRRESFGLSLAGAICALPSAILGILAIIFVSVSKKEFEAEK